MRFRNKILNTKFRFFNYLIHVHNDVNIRRFVHDEQSQKLKTLNLIFSFQVLYD